MRFFFFFFRKAFFLRSVSQSRGPVCFACFFGVNQALFADESRVVLRAKRELTHTMYHVWFDYASLSSIKTKKQHVSFTKLHNLFVLDSYLARGNSNLIDRYHFNSVFNDPSLEITK